MHYYQQHEILKNYFESEGDFKEINELGIKLTHIDFESDEAKHVLSGSEHLYCKDHDQHFEKECINPCESPDNDLDKSDFDIACNTKFKLHIITDQSIEKANGVIILFHGLNEKKWDKYLPWASEIAKKTKKAVLLFPIAFHMDRAPEFWSQRKEMYKVAQDREKNYLDNSDCSYVNAAISYRMEANPQRLFWSGLQTYSEIIKLEKLIRNGHFKNISPDTTFDLFGYSIGSFLSMIFLMANPNGMFNNSKLFCFCGGMTIDRIFPISKYIMDAKASIAMQKSFAELLSSNFASDPRLLHYQNENLHPGESWFKTMLRYNYFQEERENKIRELQHQIKAMVLKNDIVTPAIEALNTLKGGYRDIDIEVIIEDFEHPYSHMVPFPITSKNAEKVDESFTKFVNAAADFLK